MKHIPQVLRPQGRNRVSHVEDGLSGSTIPIIVGSPPQTRINPVTMEAVSNEQLATFRHLVGIYSTKGLSGSADRSHYSLHFDGRAAPNVGIYTRVCRREAAAKRGFKLAAFLINGCLGLQVIVAAALTAMGAANSNHVSITAFGAINTVIAGILTYLKGSGLPNRIRWEENEWKKVREFIEQRERDFSRPTTKLDVHGVVTLIEAMYEEVKADIANNTPDAYISVGDPRNRGQPQGSQLPNLRSLIQSAQGFGQNKVQELEPMVRDLVESLTHKGEEQFKKSEGEAAATRGKVVEIGRDAVHDARDWEEGMEEKGLRVIQREFDQARGDIVQRRDDIERGVAATTTNAIERSRNWEQDMEKRGISVAEHEFEHVRSDVDQRREDFDRDVNAVRDEAGQLRQGLSHAVAAQGARLAEAQRNIEREAHRAQDIVDQAQDGVNSAVAGFRGVADSIQRIGKAVHDELPQQRQN